MDSEPSPAVGASYLIEASRALDVLRAAAALGLIDALEPGADVAHLAARCAVSQDRLARLLRALEALHVAAREERGWRLTVTPHAVRALIAQPDLAHALRRGPVVDAAQPAGASRLYAGVARLLAGLFEEAAAELAPELRGLGPSVLELGAGALPWGRALGPDVRLTGLDLPEVVASVRASAPGVSWIAGDVFDVPLPRARFDLVLVPNLLHLFAPARGARLLERAATAVRPGGHVAVIDVLVRDGESLGRSRALYDVSLVTRTGEGCVYAAREVRGWLLAAGLTPVRARRTEAPPRVDLLLSTKENDR